MKVLHILTGGTVGGIETLCKDYVLRSKNENIVLFLNGNGILQEEMEKEGIRNIDLKTNPKNFVSIFFSIKKICKEERVNVIVVQHTAPVSFLCARIIRKLYPDVKLIGYAHSCAEDLCRHSEKKGLKLRKYIISKSLEKCDCVLAVSNIVKRSLESYLNLDNKKTKVVFNGINLDNFYSISTPKNNDCLQLIFVGRLIYEKGVDYIIRALSLLEDKNIKLRIVGDGPDREKLEIITNELQLENRVEFLGSRRDVPDLLNQADIFVHMPRWEEGFGITIIEAMACGLVCVCGNKGAVPEIIKDKEDGFIIYNESENELAHIIRMIAKEYNSSEVERIKQRAISKAKSFSIDNYTRQIDDIIKSL